MGKLSRLNQVQRIFSFGAVLMDELPIGRNIGGSPFNFAYYTHLSQVATLLISAVGNDHDGKDIIDFLKQIGMPLKWVRTLPDYPTGNVRVVLDDLTKLPSYIVRENTAYDYITETPDDCRDSIIYYGSSDQRSPTTRNTLKAYLEKSRDQAITFCDLNLRPPFYNASIVNECLSQADILKVSEDELNEVGKILKLPFSKESDLVDHLHKQFAIELTLVTKGPLGATVYPKSSHPITVKAPIIDPIADTVGAGDAFSARFLIAAIRGLDTERCLVHAVELASEICRHPGAIVPISKVPTHLRALKVCRSE